MQLGRNDAANEPRLRIGTKALAARGTRVRRRREKAHYLNLRDSKLEELSERSSSKRPS